MPAQKLPTEIILAIVEALIPENTNAILPPSHPSTKTWLALTRVCSVTRPLASEYLWRFCLYVDSAQRASQFLHSLERTSLRRFLQNGLQTRLYMGPFPLDYDEQGRALLQQIWDSDTPSPQSVLDMHIQPEPTQDGGASNLPLHPSPLNSLSTAIVVMDTFQMLAPVLTGLVIDMPLRTLYPDDDTQGVRPVLRRGFEALVNLEEFVSVRDELFLATIPNSYRAEPEVWSVSWPRLRRLALYNPIMDSQDKTWLDMVNVSSLEMAVFTRSDPGGILDEINMKSEWDLANRKNTMMKGLRIQRQMIPMTLVLVECPSGLPNFSSHVQNWQTIDPNNHFRVLTKAPPLPPPASPVGEAGAEVETNDIEICQNWIKENALNGALWKEAAQGYDCFLEHTQ